MDVGTKVPVHVSGLSLAGPQAADYFLPELGGPQPAGVVAYWRFEEGTANAAAAGADSIVDSSGHGLSGTPIGGPTYKTDVAANPVPQTGAANNLGLISAAMANTSPFPTIRSFS